MQWEPGKKQWFYVRRVLWPAALTPRQIDPTTTPPKRQWEFPELAAVVYPPPTPAPAQSPPPQPSSSAQDQQAATSPPSSPTEHWLAVRAEPIPRPPAPAPTLPGYPLRVPISPHVAPPQGKNTAAAYFSNAQAPLPETTVVLLQGSVTGSAGGGKDVFARPASAASFSLPPGAPPKPSSPAPPPAPPPGPRPPPAPQPSPSPTPSINIPGVGDVGGLLTGILGVSLSRPRRRYRKSRGPTPKPAAPASPLAPLFAIGMSQLEGRTSARPASDANTAAFVPLVDGALSLVGGKLGDAQDPLGSLIGGLNPFSGGGGGEKRKSNGGGGHRPHANSFGGFGRRELDVGAGGFVGQGQDDTPQSYGFGQQLGRTRDELYQPQHQPQYDGSAPNTNPGAWAPGHGHSASYGDGGGAAGNDEKQQQQQQGIAYGGAGHWV
ncbi:uncharacterized protein LOC62_04G006114 [Vanrija pseudolonga]|uniref:Uncharacterized protein n=1 Tax=Vanrija pseudolonga TaxID=143232 RepID=A0AAF1BIS7_9TREE|nr:hypothetical protein LOC62_04G006114 [Vanrija pseudolonga]